MHYFHCVVVFVIIIINKARTLIIFKKCTKYSKVGLLDDISRFFTTAQKLLKYRYVITLIGEKSNSGYTMSIKLQLTKVR